MLRGLARLPKNGTGKTEVLPIEATPSLPLRTQHTWPATVVGRSGRTDSSVLISVSSWSTSPSPMIPDGVMVIDVCFFLSRVGDYGSLISILDELSTSKRTTAWSVPASVAPTVKLSLR